MKSLLYDFYVVVIVCFILVSGIIIYNAPWSSPPDNNLYIFPEVTRH